MTYSEKLKDPRWQKKRLLILKRDKWTCQLCGSKERTLHVHHNKYKDEPWDANNEDLITYCHLCHEVVEFFKTEELHLHHTPAKIIVFEDPETIVCVIKKIRGRDSGDSYCFILDRIDGELSLRSALKRSWLIKIIKQLK